jgi:hypothetical protein
MPHYRKCPKCGYEEPVAWRGSAWHPDWEIADFYEFSKAYPEVADQLDDKHIGERFKTIEGDYVYWRQAGKSSHLIHRVPLVVYRANGNSCRGRGSYAEKPVFARRLTEFAS